MKKLLIFSALLGSALFAKATPGTGGYMGHRIIVAGEFAYSPFFSSFKDFYTKYNFQYGGNLNIITGRRTQLGLSYNLWSLGGNNVYEGNFDASDRVKGAEYGLTWRTFRKSRGGIAPIGKFFDAGISYAQNKFTAGSGNLELINGNGDALKKTSDQLLVHLSFGTQMVFWNRVVGNTGIRFGTPVYEISHDNGTHYNSFLMNRMRSKEYFSVFFGLGILI